MKNRQLPFQNLLLPGGTRYQKVNILKKNKLKVPLTLFAINVGGGTRVADGTT